MALSVRAKLLASYVALVAIAGALIVVAIERYLGEALVAQLDRRLERQAYAVGDWIEQGRHVDRLARRLSLVVGARVTIIDEHGMALGDSEREGNFAAADSEGLTEEVRAAHRGQVGRATRTSVITGQEMHYVVVPGPRGTAIRLAVPTSDIHATRQAMRRRLLVASTAAFVFAILLGLLVVRAVSRPLQTMTRVAERLGRGQYDVPAPSTSPDEFGVLSRTLARLADEVRARIQDLTTERDLLSAVLSGLFEAVLVIDDRGKVVVLNATAGEQLELAEGDEVLDAGLLGLRDQALAASGPVDGEVQLERRAYLANARPLAAVPTSVVIVLYDVTRLRHLETVRRDFVANISHELRTPVTSIRGYAETLLAGDPDPAIRKEFLEVIHHNALRIGRLVDDLLRLHRLEAAPATPRRLEPVPLEPLAAAAARNAAARYPGDEARVVVDLDPSLAARADAEALEQVLDNLVDNACKYGRQPGRTPAVTVRVTGERAGDRVRLRVSDDGVGIADEHLPRLFERFYRVDAGRSRDQGGSGLGLTIVKHLVEGMGGTVRVETAPDAGTTFVVDLAAG